MLRQLVTSEPLASYAWIAGILVPVFGLLRFATLARNSNHPVSIGQRDGKTQNVFGVNYCGHVVMHGRIGD